MGMVLVKWCWRLSEGTILRGPLMDSAMGGKMGFPVPCESVLSCVCMGSVPVFSRPGACDTQLFQSIEVHRFSGPPIENIKKSEVFCVFAQWFLFPFPFLPLSSFSLFPALSFFALSFSLYIFVLFIYRSSRPRFPLALAFFRGRRQLPQAGEVRRPRRARRRGGCGWLVSLSIDP